MMLKVFLVDDEHLIRKGLRKLIKWEELGFEISGEACDGEEGLELITSENTDIVITDLKMPVVDGLELSARLKEKYPGIKVIVLTGFDDFAYMQQSIRNSVMDYLLKPVNAELLTESLLKIKDSLSNGNYGYPFQLESALVNAIESNDEKFLTASVDELFNEFRKNKMPIEIEKKICGNILVTIGRRIESVGTGLSSLLKSEAAFENYFGKYRSIDELKMEFLRILAEVLSRKSEQGNRKIVEQVKEYIEKHIQDEFTLAEMAAKFYLNPSYLSQVFKSETGENYVDFLIKCRVDKARRLLENGNLRIQDISEMVGYADAKYFGQLFKKQVGVLPSEYRLKRAEKGKIK